MPRKDHAAMGDAMARLVLTSPPAKPARKASKAKPAHKRAKKSATVATMRMVDGIGFVLDINDVLTKNDRYRLIKMGRRMAQAESPNAKAYKEAVKLAALECCRGAILLGLSGAHAGLWRLDILSMWPTQRHHADGTHTANGDADAPVAMVKDALQHAGIIDDDMRIVVGSEVSVYEKGVRRTVAVLRPITAEAHAASVAAVLGVLG
jgi:Holliday junction resolvase RusA-like endonuclease